MSEKHERIPTGLDNPSADRRCGAEEGTERQLLPAPVHYDCRQCATIIREILKGRAEPHRTPPDRPQPPLFDDLSPVKHTKVRRGLS